MSDSDAWDADDYDPTPGSKAAAPSANTDKWEGEDEEDDVKDAWDADSDEEKKKDDKPAPAKPGKIFALISTSRAATWSRNRLKISGG